MSQKGEWLKRKEKLEGRRGRDWELFWKKIKKLFIYFSKCFSCIFFNLFLFFLFYSKWTVSYRVPLNTSWILFSHIFHEMCNMVVICWSPDSSRRHLCYQSRLLVSVLLAHSSNKKCPIRVKSWRGRKFLKGEGKGKDWEHVFVLFCFLRFQNVFFSLIFYF